MGEEETRRTSAGDDADEGAGQGSGDGNGNGGANGSGDRAGDGGAPATPFWRRPQEILTTVGGVVAVVGGVAGLIFLFWPDAQPRPTPEPEPEPPPAVTLVNSDVDREENIAADRVFDGEVTGRIEQSATVVSAVLRNTGDDPVLVSHAKVRFSAATQVGCPASGTGGTEIMAQYDIEAPENVGKGSVATRKMVYTLPPHAQERVAFTVGPGRHVEGALPWVYTFTISLHMDDGSTVTVPEVSYLSPRIGADGVLAGAEQAMDPGQNGGPGLMDPVCVAEQARSVAGLVSSAARPSPELREFSAELTRIAAR
ncbi:hypothetical protein AB0P17_07215 [Streptomyces sp. NPDC088124]|uniref:hypothetical protein n=1 Tax=Streptomyces sp. NPDC088124 TaxID=3154654 RepID=UPI00342502A8